MKFVILDNKEIPNFGGIRGPIMTPTSYNLHDVLKWITYDIDIREVMPDGSYRKLVFNDDRLMKEIDEELNRKRLETQFNKKEVPKIEKNIVNKNKVEEKPKFTKNINKVVDSKKAENIDKLVVDQLEKLD